MNVDVNKLAEVIARGRTPEGAQCNWHTWGPALRFNFVVEAEYIIRQMGWTPTEGGKDLPPVAVRPAPAKWRGR